MSKDDQRKTNANNQQTDASQDQQNMTNQQEAAQQIHERRNSENSLWEDDM